MRAGTIIAGRYQIEQLAGVGGMGTVYRARDLERGGRIALKLAATAGNADAVHLFNDEARALSQLEHPHIVRCVGTGETEDGDLYLATEWLEGTSLASRLRRARLTEAETLQVGRALVGALAAVHAHGILHRDVKPANAVLVGDSLDRVVLIDFGLARFVSARLPRTEESSLAGTPGFMSPEQARADPDVDARSDLYSLGATLFACLTGRPPFTGENAVAILAKLLFKPPARVRDYNPDISPALEELIEQLLAKEPGDRPESAAEVAQRLAAIDQAVPRRADPDRGQVSSVETQYFAVLLVGGVAAGAPTAGAGADGGNRDQAAADRELFRILEGYGATAHRLTDGTVVAVFRDVSAGEMVQRAARCALGLRSFRPGTSLALATGQGELGAHGPMGDVIDRAAGLLVDYDATLAADVPRVTGLVPAGELVVDAATAHLLETRFTLEPLPGVGAEWGCVLTGERVAPQPVRRLFGAAIACVGRDREIALLASLYDECVDVSAARAVLVTGDAGIGKSRVVREFLDRIVAGPDARPDAPRGSGSVAEPERVAAPRVWIAHADIMRASSPLGLLGQLVRRALGVADAGADHARRARVRERVTHVLTADPDGAPGANTDRVVTFLCRIAGVRLADNRLPQLGEARRAAQTMHDQMLMAWLDWLAAELAVGPVVCVIEDLHWSDRATVEFLDAALREARDLPLLVVATARPEVAEAHPGLWRQRDVERVGLQPLSHGARREIVEQALAGPAAARLRREQVDAMVARCEGNPFYLEELLRDAHERGGGDVPDTVLALVSARLRGLPPESRRALRAASVFGREFWTDGVAHLMGLPRHQVDAALRSLCERELIARQPRSRLEGREAYAFPHDLVREAAYAALARGDREGVHRAAGRWLEQAGEADPAVLAEHYERGRAPERALPHLHRAAAQALQASELEAVGRFVERAVAARARRRILGELRLMQAEAENWLSSHAAACEHGAEAMARLPAGSADWAHAAEMTSWAAQSIGDGERVVAIARALSEHQPARPSGAYVAAMAFCAAHLLMLGQSAEARALKLRVEACELDGQRFPSAASTVAEMQAMFAVYSGRRSACVDGFHEAARLSALAGDVRNLARLEANLGDVLKYLGCYAEAARWLRSAWIAAQRLGSGYLVGAVLPNLVSTLVRLGELDDARQLLSQELVSDEGHRHAASMHICAAELCLVTADNDAALALADRACARAEQALSLTHQASALGVRAQALLALDRPDEALASTRVGMAILDAGHGVEEGEARLRLCHAEALWAAGQTDTARREIARCRDWLLAQSGEIDDALRRRSFLENVAENRCILELAQQRTAG